MYTWLNFLNANTMMTIGNIYKMSDLKIFVGKDEDFIRGYIAILFFTIFFTILLLILHPK